MKMKAQLSATTRIMTLVQQHRYLATKNGSFNYILFLVSVSSELPTAFYS